MTANKIKEVVEKYKIILSGLNMPRIKLDNYSTCVHNKAEILSHCHWMLYEMGVLLEKGKIEKSFRWLGFIQGCFFSLGVRSLEAIKFDSAPLLNFGQEEVENDEQV